MLYLLASIVLSSYLTLFFKLLDRLKLNSFQVIVVNYFTCVVTGAFVNGSFPDYSNTSNEPWFPWAVIMGLTFISIFNVIAFTARNIGVAVASVANKLSLVIPFLFSLSLYNEKASSLQYSGIIVALIAVIFTCLPDKKRETTRSPEMKFLRIVFPVILFVGSGLLDTMIKYVEHNFLTGENNNDYLVTAFLSAGVTGLIVWIYLVMRGKLQFDKRAILAGIILGIPNYFSIFSLIEALKLYANKSGVIIPVNNMGIVLFSTIVAWIVFKEKLSLLNWAGIALSLLAIAMIAFA